MSIRNVFYACTVIVQTSLMVCLLTLNSNINNLSKLSTHNYREIINLRKSIDSMVINEGKSVLSSSIKKINYFRVNKLCSVLSKINLINLLDKSDVESFFTQIDFLIHSEPDKVKAKTFIGYREKMRKILMDVNYTYSSFDNKINRMFKLNSKSSVNTMVSVTEKLKNRLSYCSVDLNEIQSIISGWINDNYSTLPSELKNKKAKDEEIINSITDLSYSIYISKVIDEMIY